MDNNFIITVKIMPTNNNTLDTIADYSKDFINFAF